MNLLDGDIEGADLLRVHQITKSFDQHQVLNKVDLRVRRGKVLALLGDNGAGKSTLIKVLSGFHAPDSGQMSWLGRPVTMSDFTPSGARALGIQTVYQHLGLVDELSIARNFFLGSELVKTGRLNLQEMRNIVRDQLKRLGVRRQLDPDDTVASLSGGERQAIAISRARYFGARLLILDEPTSALSLRQTQEVLDYIRNARDSGVGIIFITHSLHHCKDVADEISILWKGQCLGPWQNTEISDSDCARMIMHGPEGHGENVQTL